MKNLKNPSGELSEKWKKDGRFWIWGIFYYNKDDNRIFPPKRQENMGYTINFANPKSVAFFVLMVGFFLFVVLTMVYKSE